MTGSPAVLHVFTSGKCSYFGTSIARACWQCFAALVSFFSWIALRSFESRPHQFWPDMDNKVSFVTCISQPSRIHSHNSMNLAFFSLLAGDTKIPGSGKA